MKLTKEQEEIIEEIKNEMRLSYVNDIHKKQQNLDHSNKSISFFTSDCFSIELITKIKEKFKVGNVGNIEASFVNEGPSNIRYIRSVLKKTKVIVKHYGILHLPELYIEKDSYYVQFADGDYEKDIYYL